MTFWSGVVDESDLCFLGGTPGDGLSRVFGVREEESQNYFPGEKIGFEMARDNPLGMSGSYASRDICSVISPGNARVLASYADDYFAGSPALTVNRHGRGEAYYLASRNEARFLADFYRALVSRLSLEKSLDAALPPGVTARYRTDGRRRYLFLMNFNGRPERVEIGPGFTDLLSGKKAGPAARLDRFGVAILARPEEKGAGPGKGKAREAGG